MLENSNGTEFVYALKYAFPISNNESEKELLIEGLQIVLAMNIEQLIIRGESNVVFGHVMGSFETKEDTMKKYSIIVKSLETRST